MIFGQACQVPGENHYPGRCRVMRHSDRARVVFATGHKLAPHKSNVSEDWLLFDSIAGQRILQ
jgi:hypothetical protein